MKAKLLLNNGMIFEGTLVGKEGTVFGELSINSAMAGYQEMLTDPSNFEQILVMTYPEIGNYGINKNDFENEKVYAKGLVMKNYCYDDNHYQSVETLSTFLQRNNVTAITDVDTRQLTKLVRENGTLTCTITTEEITDKLKTDLKNWTPNTNAIKEISQNKKYHIEGSGTKFAIIDLGLKKSILNNLINANCDINIFPYNAKADEILNSKPDGVIFSNGAGNPQDATESIELAKELIGKIPLFGICSGAQIIALALGIKTAKLKLPHKGSNHPAINLETNKVFLTTQNHTYVIDENTLPANAKVTFKNLNDNTVEGFRIEELKIDTVQFHPIAQENGTDETEIFNSWINKTEGYKLCQKM